jgi:hypothetical protein
MEELKLDAEAEIALSSMWVGLRESEMHYIIRSSRYRGLESKLDRIASPERGR